MTKEISVTDLKPGMEACLPRWGWVRIKSVKPVMLIHYEGGQVYVEAASTVPVVEVDAP